ncbi:MAG: XylR N-terminal domain-containing protein [Planctomycetes bacterium]|nr:XylR N-terminal domain-containing protein [Planctomycetota bacterium]
MAQKTDHNSILSGIEYDPSNGALIFNNTRYLLIRPETIIGFQKNLEVALGKDKTAEVLYKGGFEGGSRTANKFMNEQKLSAEQILKFMCDMGTQIGWGAFKVGNFSDVLSKFELTVKSSVYAQAYGQSTAPVCHFISGVFGGVSSIICHEKPKVKEIQCSSSGAQLCRFATISNK